MKLNLKNYPVFAYLRKSTSKKEQEESLGQQKDGVMSIMDQLGIDPENVIYFAETKSGFENKTRKQFSLLLKAIDKLRNQTCIILVRDTSRLTRNPNDSQEIMDRLFGDNKRKRSIEKIFYLDYDKIQDWNTNSDKDMVHRRLSDGYYDSLDTRRKSIQGILLKLRDGYFTYHPPAGLKKSGTEGKMILEQSEKMSAIRMAFEMKVGGKSHKEISGFLKQYGVSVGDRDLSDRIFTNTVYIGLYTEKTTGNEFKLRFIEGHPPISIELWDKTKKVLGRKTSLYGQEQLGDVIADKLRTVNGKRMSKYLAKGKYPNYKNTSERINVSEREVLGGFLNGIKKMVDFLKEQEAKIFIANQGIFENEDWVLVKKPPAKKTKKKTDFNDGCDDTPYVSNSDYVSLAENMDIIEHYRDFAERAGYFSHPDIKSRTEAEKTAFNNGDCGELRIANKQKIHFLARYRAIKKFSKELDELFLVANADLVKVKQQQLSNLEKELTTAKTTLKNLAIALVNGKIDDDTYAEVKKDTEKSIQALEAQIFEMNSNRDIEQYLEKIPNILFETVELACNAINKANSEGFKEDILKLLEFTTVELTIDNKKDLKVKVFQVLDRLVSDDYSALEAPPGVEPGYEALQAPT